MKKFLLSIIAFFAMTSLAFAQETSTISVTFSDYTAGTQYAENEVHVINDALTIYTTQCHFTSELRIYSSSTHNGYVVSNALPGAITQMTFNAGNKVDKLNVYGSTDGQTWVLIGAVDVTATSYKDYSIDFPSESNYTYFKLDVEGANQIRIKTMSVTHIKGVITKVATPVITPASGEITANTEISISCATDDATIKYTIDGTEPTADNGEVYTDPFTLSASESTTVKAIAIDPNGTLEASAVATATYVVYANSEYSYKLATSVENGGHYIIVGEKDGNYFAMGAKRDGKNNRESIDVTLDENGAITKPSVKVSEIELQGSEGAWNLYSPNENAYLYNDNGGSNKLILSSESTEMTKASITFSETTAVITFINVTGANPDETTGITTQANILQYNPGDNLFSCYKNTQLPVYLYQREGDVPTGIEDTMVDANAPIEYYNLQGVKVANPENGIFIKKQGAKATKVVL